MLLCCRARLQHKRKHRHMKQRKRETENKQRTSGLVEPISCTSSVPSSFAAAGLNNTHTVSERETERQSEREAVLVSADDVLLVDGANRQQHLHRDEARSGQNRQSCKGQATTIIEQDLRRATRGQKTNTAKTRESTNNHRRLLCMQSDISRDRNKRTNYSAEQQRRADQDNNKEARIKSYDTNGQQAVRRSS